MNEYIGHRFVQCNDKGSYNVITLVNAFETVEVTINTHGLILRAEEKMMSLEYKLFTSIRNTLKNYTYELQTLAKTLAELDMMLSFTKVSNDNKRKSLCEMGISHQ